MLRQVHRGLSLSHDSVNILDSFVKDTFERIAEEAGRLARNNKRRTITTEDISKGGRITLQQSCQGWHGEKTGGLIECAEDGKGGLGYFR